jgi:AraC-like DNA-binding protein
MVQRIRCALTENLEHNIRMEEVAASLNISYTIFRRIFKKKTGSSAAVAQALLAETKLKPANNRFCLAAAGWNFLPGCQASIFRFRFPPISECFKDSCRKKTGTNPHISRVQNGAAARRKG